MSEQDEGVTRGEDGQWETKEEAATGKGVATGVVVGVALGVGCLCMVSVIGILAAIAIPNFLAMQLRAKRAEMPMNVDAIRTAEKAYHAEWDAFTTVQTCPPEWVGLGTAQIGWDYSWDCYSGFENLGWTPDGMTRCRYGVVALNDPTSAANDDFEITAECDIDGDGLHSVYMANRASKAWMVSPNNYY
jgi:hypothetical protein